MKAVWLGIYERGVITSERVHFRASVDFDLNFYVIVDTKKIDNGRIFLNQRSCFWFAPLKIKAGDNIVLYTRQGVPSVETRKDGGVFHFLFRGLDKPIYAEPQDCAVLLEINSWITT